MGAIRIIQRQNLNEFHIHLHRPIDKQFHIFKIAHPKAATGTDTKYRKTYTSSTPRIVVHTHKTVVNLHQRIGRAYYSRYPVGSLLKEHKMLFIKIINSIFIMNFGFNLTQVNFYNPVLALLIHHQWLGH